MSSIFDKFKFGKKPPQAKNAPSAGERPSVAPAAGDARDTGIAVRVLRSVHATEKATRLGGLRQYVFVVSISATKLQVKDAVRRVYGVRPSSVNMIRVAGKQVRFGRTRGRQNNWKKAVVTLPVGSQLHIGNV